MIIAWPFVKTFLKANWKPVAAAGVVLFGVVWHKLQVQEAWTAGRAALLAEQAEEAKRRNENAQAADAVARKCAANPACRLLDDGHRRD
jgi:hypothetical protein